MEISCTIYWSFTECWFTSESDTNTLKLNCYHFLCSGIMFLCLHFLRWEIRQIALEFLGLIFVQFLWNKKEMERKDTLRFTILTIYGVLQYLMSCLLFTFPWRTALWSECIILNAIHMQSTSLLFPLMDCLWGYLSNKTWWGIALQPVHAVKEKVTNVFNWI